MGLYNDYVLPILIERGMQNRIIRKYRPLMPPHASGRVLEVGFGSGMNVPYYSNRVDHLFGLEPSGKLLAGAEDRINAAPFPVDTINCGAEFIPLDSRSIDTIVTTWTLCSIPKIDEALQEMRRILKPGGRLLFLEHGRAPDRKVAKMQRRLKPVFKVLAGCDPSRRIAPMIKAAGFRFLELEESYLDGPKFVAFHYRGQATPV